MKQAYRLQSLDKSILLQVSHELQIGSYITQYLTNGTSQCQSYYRMWIWSRMHSTEWCHF